MPQITGKAIQCAEKSSGTLSPNISQPKAVAQDQESLARQAYLKPLRDRERSLFLNGGSLHHTPKHMIGAKELEKMRIR